MKMFLLKLSDYRLLKLVKHKRSENQRYGHPMPHYFAIAAALRSSGIFSMAYLSAVRGITAFFDIT